MKAFNNRDILIYLVYFLSTIAILMTFVAEEPGLGLFVIGCWIFLFIRDYYREFRKPKEERSYDTIVGSVGFVLGLAFTIVGGAEFRTILKGGVLGFASFYILWFVLVYFLKDRHPQLFPSEGGEGIDEEELYEDIG